MRIDPDGMLDGDYYDKEGNWITSDGINDGRVYHANEKGNVTYGVGILKDTQFSEWNYSISDPKLQEYFPTLLSHEGGFVNHPNDPGGATNKGITLNTFKKYSKDLLNVQPTLGNLKRLSDSQAAAIYEAAYWNPSGAGNISDKQLGWLHFDTYLHGGAANVLRNTIGFYGESGKSISTLNSILKVNSAEDVFNTYKQERLNRFDRIIENNPKLNTFKKGWTNRVNRFQYQTP
jgi:lysozyme family protein